MKKILLLVCWVLPVLFGETHLRAEPFEHPGAPYTRSDLAMAKQRAFAGRQPWADARRELLKEADEGLKRPVVPGPKVRVIPRRYADPAGHLKAREQIDRDAWAACVLALAAHLTDDPRQSAAYAKKAATILKVWTATGDIGTYDANHPSDHRESALVACTAGSGLITAADLLYDNPNWPAADRAAFLHWTRQVYYPATEIRTIAYDNNWNCWGIYAHLQACRLTDDRTGFNASSELLKKAIATQIEDDGGMPKELARGEGRHWYTYYALTPLTLSAYIVGNATGENLIDPAGATGRRLALGMRYFVSHLQWEPYRDLLEGYGGLTGVSDYLTPNRGKRPVVGIRAHNGWHFPTLFIKTEVVPVNRPPHAVAAPAEASVAVGDEVEFDASGSTDPDGTVQGVIWNYPADDETFIAPEPLRAAGDVFVFPRKLEGSFTVSFRIKMNRTANLAVALQSEADTGASWGGSSYLLVTKDGRLQVRDGSGYRSDHEVAYQPGDTLRIRMEVRAQAKTYDVFADTGGGEVRVAANYAIRDDKKERRDIRRLRIIGEPGADITDVRVVAKGGAAEGKKVRVKFTQAEAQAVRLTVTDDLGATDTVEIPVTVSP